MLNSDNRDIAAVETLLKCFREQQVDAEDVFAFLGKIYDYSDKKDKTFLLRVSMLMEWADLERMYRGIFLPQEREEFDAAMETAHSGAPLS